MLCKNPYVDAAGRAYGCGQCMSCRYNRRRIWMHRIMLEAAQYENNAFVTLTYSDENLPEGGTLVPKHLRDFLNRLRGRVAPERFRFFAVGEYGDASERPHYHVAIFNFGSCQYGQSRYSRFKARCCDRCELVRETWGLGQVHLGTLEDDSAGYMAGYVTKKMTMPDDPRLKGRHPEFSRMSNQNGGIGYPGLWEIASTLMEYDLEDKLVDVPTSLRHGMRQLPLGRYLRVKLREMIGRDGKAPQEVMDEIEKEMRPLRLAARLSAETPSVKDQIIADGRQGNLNMEARNKIWKSRKSL